MDKAVMASLMRNCRLMTMQSLPLRINHWELDAGTKLASGSFRAEPSLVRAPGLVGPGVPGLSPGGSPQKRPGLLRNFGGMFACDWERPEMSEGTLWNIRGNVLVWVPFGVLARVSAWHYKFRCSAVFGS